jgi:ferritin-like metal-binding protein YciE
LGTRLEKVFEELDEAPRGKTCDAIMGIIEEGQEVMKEFKGKPALDAALLAAVRRSSTMRLPATVR